MAQHNLDGLRVAILVTDNFEQVEMTDPRDALDRAGAETVLISPKGGEVRGINHDKGGQTFKVDLSLSDANPDDFDALLLPGGAMNADKLRVEPNVQQFVRKMDKNEKPIAIICHAPWIVISAGLVRGRQLTGYHTIKDDLVNAGAHYEDKEVIRDRNWVSSRQPQDIPAFNREMLQLFSEHVLHHA
ncbi:MAG TPA: type 1 glutamine amidotransferase domain-containing protein [Candidatus Kapabacteria bacterium]|nr:type 1 glutamine amidotransferase domain-containing protein [Candidatus Kapabacteria bacterium]